MNHTVNQEALIALLRQIFTDILPRCGFAVRKRQIEMSQEVLSSICHLEIGLAESAVGTGKTLAYLIPAVLARRARVNEGKIPTTLPSGRQAPVTIATSSIALQRAIVCDHIPALSAILVKAGIIKSPLTAVLRKGKNNYVCERRLINFISAANLQTRLLVEPVLQGPVVDLAAVTNATPYIRRNICVSDSCTQDCSLHDSCRYMRFVRSASAGGYDIQVVNHNLFLADLLRRSAGERSLLSDYQAVIFDEAHRFFDAARDMYGSVLSLAKLDRAASDISDMAWAHGQSTADVTRAAERILSKSRLLFQFLNKEVPAELHDDTERFPTHIREKTARLISALQKDIDTLAQKLKRRVVMPVSERQLGLSVRALAQADAALEAFSRHEDLVYWLEGEAGGGGGGGIGAGSTASTGVGGGAGAGTGTGRQGFHLDILRGMPKNLGVMLHRDLWSLPVPIILTSGTLSVAGSFEHIKRKAGLDCVLARRLRETTKPSPFDYRKNALVYISEDVPFPDNGDEGYLAAVADEAERLIRAACGHTALLFTSYKAMDMVYARIATRDLPYPVFRLDKGNTFAIERFRRSKGGVLFASGALWEGIDIPGDVLSLLIIVRLPFAVPDPISEWERTLYHDFEDYRTKVIVPEMLIKLKQGFGRLIRGETDTGVVAILDSRAGVGGAYRKRILAALPPCGVTSDIIDVERFIQSKKGPGYFEA
jgi:ATP-dependent DNA helicase DinG